MLKVNNDLKINCHAFAIGYNYVKAALGGNSKYQRDISIMLIDLLYILLLYLQILNNHL